MKIKIILCLLYVFIATNSFGQFATIRGQISILKDSDVVSVTVNKYGHFFSSCFKNFDTTYKCVVFNHQFYLHIPLPKNIPVAMRIGFNNPTIKLESQEQKPYINMSVAYGLLEDGDNIFIKDTINGISFTGVGAQKNNVIRQVNAIYNRYDFRYDGIVNSTKAFLGKDSASVYSLKYLETNKEGIDDKAYSVLKGFIVGFSLAKDYINFGSDSLRAVALKDARDHYRDNVTSTFSLNQLNKKPELQYSEFYCYAIYRKYLYDSCSAHPLDLNIRKYYTFLTKNYSGALRERLTTDLFYMYRNKKEFDVKLLDDALNWITNKDFIEVLHSLKTSRVKGMPAFDFKLRDEKNNLHTLQDYKGKVIFLDFWYTGCENCIKVNPYMAKIESRFLGKPVVFLSINLDKNKEGWIKSVKGGKYTTKLAVNLFTEGLAFNHPISKFYNVDGGPTLVMIDKEGKMMGPPLDPRLDDGKDIMSKINSELGYK